MPVPFQVIIDEVASRKLAANGVTELEVHEVFASPESRQAPSRSSGRPVVFGPTATGRMLAIVIEVELTEPLTFSVVTAYEPDAQESHPRSSKRRPKRRRGKGQP